MDIPSPSRDGRAVERADVEVGEISLGQLVGDVFENATVAERARLIDPLLRPLGVLSLACIANGIFARLRFRGGWPDFQVRLDDLAAVRTSDVVALVDYLQQTSAGALDQLHDVVTGSPALASSAAAALLVAVLMRRARPMQPMERRAADMDHEDPSP